MRTHGYVNQKVWFIPFAVRYSTWENTNPSYHLISFYVGPFGWSIMWNEKWRD